MRILGDTSDFNPAEILEGLRRAVHYKPQTTIEAKEILADWWEALAAELHGCRRETLTGFQNHRVTEEDTDHAGQMHVWLRWEAANQRWAADRENQRAIAAWDAVKPQAGASKEEIARAMALLSEPDRERLKARPRSPEKADPPVPRPRNYLPPSWPPIPMPLRPWSVYLGWLLTEKRARAGIVDREPGEDPEEDDDAAE